MTKRRIEIWFDADFETDQHLENVRWGLERAVQNWAYPYFGSNFLAQANESSLPPDHPLTVDELLQKTFPQDYPWPFIPVEYKDLLRVGHFAATVGQNDTHGDNRPCIAMCTCGWVGNPRYNNANAMDEATRHIQTHKE